MAATKDHSFLECEGVKSDIYVPTFRRNLPTFLFALQHYKWSCCDKLFASRFALKDVEEFN
jgi:hypothetical protein